MRNNADLLFALLVFLLLSLFVFKVNADALELSPSERSEAASVVYAEAGGEDDTAMQMIAQAILCGCEREGVKPSELFEAYRYATWRPEPSNAAYAAVDAVFEDGARPIDGEPLYFYAADRIDSEWHEKQEFLIEYRGIRFFGGDTY